jgi:hypothetical protein
VVALAIRLVRPRPRQTLNMNVPGIFACVGTHFSAEDSLVDGLISPPFFPTVTALPY